MLSLPVKGALCPLTAVLEGSDKLDLEGFRTRLLLPEGELAARRASEGRARAYWDPCLVDDDARYLALVQSLFDRGMLRFGLQCRSSAGFFLCEEKDRQTPAHSRLPTTPPAAPAPTPDRTRLLSGAE